MNHSFYTNENKEEESEYEYSTEGEYEDEDDNEDFQCKNMDPALARLMGIIIEEQKIKTDWKPPSKSGLDNSEKIVSFATHLKDKGTIKDNDFFEMIKDDIKHYNTLTDKQLDYIKGLDSDKKFELIEIYNHFCKK